MKGYKTLILSAYFEAKKRKHEYMCLEHLLYILLFENEIVKIVDYCKGDIFYIKQQVDKYLDTHIKKISTGDPTQTESMIRLLDRFLSSKKEKGKNFIEWLNQNHLLPEKMINVFIEDSCALLFLILLEKDSNASYFLKTVDVDKTKLMKCLLSRHKKTEIIEYIKEKKKPKKKFKNLQQYAVNLIQKAQDGKIDPLIGRKAEINRVTHILCRRKKNNPILVGEPGVGKSAIIEGLAYNIFHKQVHSALQDIIIYSVDLGALVAGTRYRGDFEQRIKTILEEIRYNSKIVLFIDEIHNIIGAGSSYSGTLDVGNLLKPALANGEIKCVGATTYKEFQNVFEKDAALSRRFQKVDVAEPSPKETIAILQGIKKNYEEFYGIEYTNEAIETSVRLARRYIGNKFFPDKAIDILDEAGANFILGNSLEIKKVSKETIEDTVHLMGYIPKNRKENEKELIRNLAAELKKQIYGQDNAVEKLVSCVKRSQAGFADHKPIGSFLFSGPTGVGKTEISKQLAKALQIKFIRFDMSEYMEQHSVAKLVGAPPGYVGYEQRGLLTDTISKTPHCVLLLDEIEKAHPAIYNILLQVMDNATLTDSFGVKVDFQYVILIMTSNIGTQYSNTNFMGFGDENYSQDKQAVKKEFAPEFLNRLNATIHFAKLTDEHILKIVDKNLGELRQTLSTKDITLIVQMNAKKWFATHGYHSQFGARPIERLIQREVKDKLAEEILFGSLQQGGKVVISVKNKKLVFRIQSLV